MNKTPMARWAALPCAALLLAVAGCAAPKEEPASTSTPSATSAPVASAADGADPVPNLCDLIDEGALEELAPGAAADHRVDEDTTVVLSHCTVDNHRSGADRRYLALDARTDPVADHQALRDALGRFCERRGTTTPDEKADGVVSCSWTEPDGMLYVEGLRDRTRLLVGYSTGAPGGVSEEQREQVHRVLQDVLVAL